MSLYGKLHASFGPKAAHVLTALCYAVIIALIILLLPIDSADFRYGSY